MLGSSEEVEKARRRGQVVSDTTDGGLCILPLAEKLSNNAALHLRLCKIAPKVARADDAHQQHHWNPRGVEQFYWVGGGVATNTLRFHLQFNSEVL